jgi:iron complex outermembrane receptor protein
MLNPILSFRTHIDTFVLDRDRPDFYANRHQSFTYGAQIIGYLDLKKFGYFTSGIELYRDSLNSTRLGVRSLQRGAIFFQIEKKYFSERMIIISGIRDDYYWNIKNSINPHISFAYKIFPSLKFNSSLGNSFRAPSFTELYYCDPANKGDSLLKPEYAWGYESGIEFYNKRFIGSFCSFYRKTEDDIDWVKKEGETIWQAKNIARALFQGFETNIRLYPASWSSFNTGFTYLTIKTELPSGYISKYALRVPEFTFTAGFSIFSIFDLSCRLNKYYESEANQFYLNSRLKKSIRILSRHSMLFSFVIDNILDKKYEDYLNVPLPGRELKFKLNIKEI